MNISVHCVSRTVFFFPEYFEPDAVPDIGNAFGKMSDFYFFTKGIFDDTVKTLQMRLLGSALSEIMAVKDSSKIPQLLLKFLPPRETAGLAVLSMNAAEVIAVLRCLAEVVDAIACAGDEAADAHAEVECLLPDNINRMSVELEVLKAGNIRKFSTPLAKFAASQGLKKLIQQFTAEKTHRDVDQAALARSDKVKKEIDVVEIYLMNEKTAEFKDVTQGCYKLQSLILAMASLPSGPRSKCAEVRQSALHVREALEDTKKSPFLTWLTSSQ